MPEEIFIIALAAIVFGSGMIIYIAKNIFDVVKIKANKGKSGGDINPQFFKALGEFKKSTERRISNLESIVADLEEEKIRIQEPSAGEIEIEEKEVRAQKEEKDDSNLRNMLNE